MATRAACRHGQRLSLARIKHCSDQHGQSIREILMRRTHSWRTMTRLYLTGALLLSCGACSAGGPCYPTRGQVLVGGKPATGAVVTLTPRNSPGAEAPKTSGRVGPDGWFTLNTFEAGA